MTECYNVVLTDCTITVDAVIAYDDDDAMTVAKELVLDQVVRSCSFDVAFSDTVSPTAEEE